MSPWGRSRQSSPFVAIENEIVTISLVLLFSPRDTLRRTSFPFKPETIKVNARKTQKHSFEDVIDLFERTRYSSRWQNVESKRNVMLMGDCRVLEVVRRCRFAVRFKVAIGVKLFIITKFQHLSAPFGSKLMCHYLRRAVEARTNVRCAGKGFPMWRRWYRWVNRRAAVAKTNRTV